jgi:hypothetical protein
MARWGALRRITDEKALAFATAARIYRLDGAA